MSPRAHATWRPGDLEAIALGGHGVWRVERSKPEKNTRRAYGEIRAWVRAHPFNEDLEVADPPHVTQQGDVKQHMDGKVLVASRAPATVTSKLHLMGETNRGQNRWKLWTWALAILVAASLFGAAGNSAFTTDRDSCVDSAMAGAVKLAELTGQPVGENSEARLRGALCD